MAARHLTIAIVPNAFKGSLSALEAATRIERGLKRAIKGVRTVRVPMADGGDGTVRAIVEATGGRLLRRKVGDPLGRPVAAEFGVTGDGATAVIEMATASGLALLKPRERNPMRTTTAGTGELIRCALDANVRRILIGIGGSATTDGGAGMARALGVRFLDRAGRALPGTGGALARLDRIDATGRDARLDRVAIEVACDVDNPLTGPRGAARVYGPQKGATSAMVRALDANLRRLARIVRRDLGVDVLRTPGAGAAGGLGAGLMAFAGGVLRPGVDIVIDVVGLERHLRGCDLVITGEGRLDGQACYGKAPAGVARVARRLGIPVIAIAGSLGSDARRTRAIGIHAYFSALQEAMDESEFPSRGPAMLEDCAEQVGRLIALDPMPRGGRGRVRSPRAYH
jgi:glycerate kinase